jgi:hypothetical protein
MNLSKQDLEELEASGVIAPREEVGKRSTVYAINDPDAFKAWVAEHKKPEEQH